VACFGALVEARGVEDRRGKKQDARSFKAPSSLAGQKAGRNFSSQVTKSDADETLAVGQDLFRQPSLGPIKIFVPQAEVPHALSLSLSLSLSPPRGIRAL
jgi:hypothetical protein